MSGYWTASQQRTQWRKQFLLMTNNDDKPINGEQMIEISKKLGLFSCESEMWELINDADIDGHDEIRMSEYLIAMEFLASSRSENRITKDLIDEVEMNHRRQTVLSKITSMIVNGITVDAVMAKQIYEEHQVPFPSC